VAVLLVLLAALPAPAAEPPAFRPSKADLAASTKPLRLHGVDWFSRLGAARAKEMRMHRPPGHERLILQMRMLGPLDGAT